jgi:hypothetical protein
LIYMARQEGVEPPTNRIGTCYSIQLSYWRICTALKKVRASAKKPYDTCVEVEVQGLKQRIFTPHGRQVVSICATDVVESLLALSRWVVMSV